MSGDDHGAGRFRYAASGRATDDYLEEVLRARTYALNGIDTDRRCREIVHVDVPALVAEVRTCWAVLEAVRALVESADARSPIGAQFDRQHPEAPAAVAVATRDLRATLRTSDAP